MSRDNEKNEINIEKSSQNKIPKPPRSINKKNVAIVLIGIIVLIFLISSVIDIMSTSATKNIEKNIKAEDFEEKTISEELSEQNYANRRTIDAINEKISESNLEEEYNPDYDIPAEEPDPIAEYIKQQELEKVKRHYEARQAPFKQNVLKSNYDSSSLHDSNSYSSTTLNNEDYIKYLTAAIDDNSDPNMQKEKKNFLKNAAVNNFVLKNALVPSLTKYEVKAGSVIPIVLIGAINSDLPSTISALVREDIYDSNSGTEKLIPAGSKLFGEVSSELSFGQTRVQAVFNRLTLPNGKSIALDAMRAGDADGQGGLSGNVDMHLGKVFGSIIIAAAIGGAEGALTNNGRYERDKNAALSGAGEAAGGKGIEVTDKYASKFLDVQPTITTDYGKKAILVVEKDIILEKYSREIKYLTD